MENVRDATSGQKPSQWIADDLVSGEVTPSAAHIRCVEHQGGLFGRTPFSKEEQRRIHAALNVPPEIGQGEAIAEANRIFGFNGWSRTIKKITVIEEEQGDSGWCVVASATVAVILKNGTCHEDTGTGIIKDVVLKGSAIVQAEKIAVDDATRRVMRFFGIHFDVRT